MGTPWRIAYTGRRRVHITRVYEIECTECGGIIDGDRSRTGAEEKARIHRAKHREIDQAKKQPA